MKHLYATIIICILGFGLSMAQTPYIAPVLSNDGESADSVKTTIGIVNIDNSLLLSATEANDNNSLQSNRRESQESVIAEELDTDSIQIPKYESISDSLLAESHPDKQLMSLSPLPPIAFMPAVFVAYSYPDTTSVFASDITGNETTRWLEDCASRDKRYQKMLRNLLISRPEIIRYNITMLPEVPRKYVVAVNPEDHTIEIKEEIEIPTTPVQIDGTSVKKVHWLKTFNASLQFSEAYISPNWYQGGNNNLNAILNVYYNVKLNPAYHKNLLFENTIQYKLGLNSTPDDSLRKYNVSEDIFQVNTVFGVKAARKWYYSFTLQFKTQLVNSYTTNTNNLRSALLSPGELNLGLGMTYNTANANKTFTFDASISPLSYNLMVCTNENMNVAAFGIDPGKKTASKFGSSGECKLTWKMFKNVTLNSRLFGFTNYNRAYADWENTFVFEITKYLSTQLFIHLRYDTDTPPTDNADWHKLQVKEILSLGFAYKFSTL